MRDSAVLYQLHGSGVEVGVLWRPGMEIGKRQTQNRLPAIRNGIAYNRLSPNSEADSARRIILGAPFASLRTIRPANRHMRLCAPSVKVSPYPCVVDERMRCGLDFHIAAYATPTIGVIETSFAPS